MPGVPPPSPVPPSFFLPSLTSPLEEYPALDTVCSSPAEVRITAPGNCSSFWDWLSPGYSEFTWTW